MNLHGGKTGPMWAAYKTGDRGSGLMLSVSGRGVILSGAVAGQAALVGWYRKGRPFRRDFTWSTDRARRRLVS